MASTSSFQESLNRYARIGREMAETTRRRGEELLRELARDGEVTRGQTGDFVEECIERGRKTAAHVTELIDREQIGGALAKLLERCSDPMGAARHRTSSSDPAASASSEGASGSRPSTAAAAKTPATKAAASRSTGAQGRRTAAAAKQAGPKPETARRTRSSGPRTPRAEPGRTRPRSSE